MRTVFSRLLLLIYFSGLCLAAPAVVVSEEQKLEKINKELAASKEKLVKTKKEEAAVLGRLVVITNELKKTSSSLHRAEKTIQANERQIGTLSVELKKTETDLNKKEVSLRKRVREVYKSSGLSYLELLFTSQSLSDFLNRMYFFSRTVAYDAALVSEVQTAVNQAKSKRSLLKSRTDQVKKLAGEIEEKKKEIKEKADEKEKIYQTLQQRRKEHEARVAELEKSSKELEVLILKKMASRQGAKILGSGIFARPAEGRYTSPFGWRRHPLWGGRNFHTGLDIANKYGTPVKSADAGEVIYSGWWDGYGKAIVVDHGRSITTVYGHLSRIYKQVGDVVAKGQIIGLMGSTGYSTGPHLHFEVRKKGKPVNPRPYLN